MKPPIEWTRVFGINISLTVIVAGIATVFFSPNSTGAIAGVGVAILGTCLMQYFWD